MPVLARDGRDLAYRLADRGDGGPTLLFVHGSGADRGVWKAQDRLAREHRVVAIDLPGHGDSADVDAAAGPEALEAYARDVAALADAVDADVLVGNSLGGAVVQWVLLAGWYDPAGAVLVGSGAKLAVRADLREWLATDFERAIAFLHGPNRLFADPDPAMVEASKAAMRACGRRVTERDYLTCHVFDVRADLEAIDVPTLAIGGALDELTPPRYHTYLAEHLPDGRVELVDDAAHLVMLERPQSVNRHLRTFAAEVT
ncbi:MAG: alpha/beta fold hydrolase [Halobacteriales archaeon]